MSDIQDIYPTEHFKKNLGNGMSVEAAVESRMRELGFYVEALEGDEHIQNRTLNPDFQQRQSYFRNSDLTVEGLAIEIKGWGNLFTSPASWQCDHPQIRYVDADGRRHASGIEDEGRYWDAQKNELTRIEHIPVEPLQSWDRKDPKPDLVLAVPRRTAGDEATWIMLWASTRDTWVTEDMHIIHWDTWYMAPKDQWQTFKGGLLPDLKMRQAKRALSGG